MIAPWLATPAALFQQHLLPCPSPAPGFPQTTSAPSWPGAAEPEASELGNDVVLYLDIGAALYVTRASAQEIHRSNRTLSRAGKRNFYGTARHQMENRNLPAGGEAP